MNENARMGMIFTGEQPPPITAPAPGTHWLHQKRRAPYEVREVARREGSEPTWVVIYRQRGEPYSWVRPLAEWQETVAFQDVHGTNQTGPRFIPLTEETFWQSRSVASHAHFTWGVVSFRPLDEVRHSQELRVAKVSPAWDAAGIGLDQFISVSTGGGRHKNLPVATHVVPGGPWVYREDARAAKLAFVREHKIHRTTSAEVWGYDGE